MSGHLDGRICSSADLAREQVTKDSDPPLHCLTRGQSIGLTLTVEAGFISGIAVLVAFALVIRNKLRFRGERLIKQPMDVYVLSLFSADLVQALGAVMDLKWVNDGKVEIGGFCTAQGTVKQLGETTVAIITLIITIHTFWVIWMRSNPFKRRILWAWVLVVITLLFIVLFIAISAGTHNDRSKLYYAPTYSYPLLYWCWVGKNYLAYRLAGEYVWLWLTLAVAIVLYGLLLVMFIRRSDTSWNSRTWWADARTRTALCMTVYPITYSLEIIPLSIVRLKGFKQELTGDRQNHVSSALTLFAITIFGLSGVFNVLLFMITRPGLLLFTKEPSSMAVDSEGVDRVATGTHSSVDKDCDQSPP